MAQRTSRNIMKESLSEIVFSRFLGFKNRGFHLDEKFPYFINNMEILPDGSLIGRRKLKKVIDLPNTHSPFKIDENIFLCASNQGGFDKIYKINIREKTFERIIDTTSPYRPFYYCRVDNRIYISNRFWNGIYFIDDDTVTSWAPIKTYTFGEAKEASEYVLAEAIPMPQVENLCLYAGRIFGSRGKRLWYTEALFHEIVLPYYFIDFPEEINIVLTDNVNLYISTQTKTYIGFPGEGSEFNLSFRRYDIGSLKGSGIVVNEIPIWLCEKGIVYASGGKIYLYTQDNVLAVFNGEFFSGNSSNNGFIGGEVSNIEFDDEIICEVIKKEKNE